MQLEMSEDIRLGSPDDGSNNLDSDFPVTGPDNLVDHQNRADSYRAESARRWTLLQDNPFNSGNPQPSASGKKNGTCISFPSPLFFFLQIRGKKTNGSACISQIFLLGETIIDQS
ncbi:hypothetical protein OIU74_019782 [Salix koriyanagi]|uniref:Uncharacterized protein n=1 Tax=Salix koriyanagi TaxID=2511006 RepID=A0A9Q0P4K2_9ROSI|nr:hypothetical protein OIU74_019782 [Salix koriyanagi]